MQRYIALMMSVLVAQAASASVVLYQQDFEGVTPGSLVGAPQGGWEGFAFQQAGDPAIVDHDGSRQLKVVVNAVPADNAIRQESRAVLTLPTPIDLAQWTDMLVQYDLTLPAGASGGGGERHNFYYDFDGNPDRYGPMTINDGGNVGMIDGGVLQNLAVNPVTLTMRWVFDLTDLGDIKVDTYYGYDGNDLTGLDQGVSIAGKGFFAGDEFTQFSLALVKDFRTAPFGYEGYLDNFEIWATPIPEPGIFALAGLGLLGFLRRRR